MVVAGAGLGSEPDSVPAKREIDVEGRRCSWDTKRFLEAKDLVEARGDGRRELRSVV